MDAMKEVLHVSKATREKYIKFRESENLESKKERGIMKLRGFSLGGCCCCEFLNDLQ